MANTPTTKHQTHPQYTIIAQTPCLYRYWNNVVLVKKYTAR